MMKSSVRPFATQYPFQSMTSETPGSWTKVGSPAPRQAALFAAPPKSMSSQTSPMTGFSLAMLCGATQFSFMVWTSPPVQSFPWRGTRQAHRSLWMKPFGFWPRTSLAVRTRATSAAT
jgi:hypothetical protein